MESVLTLKTWITPVGPYRKTTWISHVQKHMWSHVATYTCDYAHVKFHVWNQVKIACEACALHMENMCFAHGECVFWNIFMWIFMWIPCETHINPMLNPCDHMSNIWDHMWNMYIPMWNPWYFPMWNPCETHGITCESHVKSKRSHVKYIKFPCETHGIFPCEKHVKFMWFFCKGGDDTKAISLQLRNQSTVKLFNQNLFRLYLYDAVFYLLMVQIGSFKADGLVSFDSAKFYIMFNMNFTKDLVLCEIIERHEGKSIIVVVIFFIVGLQNDTVLTVMVCAWTSVKYL